VLFEVLFALYENAYYGIVRFCVLIDTLYVILGTILQVKWPNQQSFIHSFIFV